MTAATKGTPLRAQKLYTASCLLFFALLAVALLPGPLSATETASFQVRHIPLEEAKGLAQTQLSAEGQLSTLPSRSLLIVVDQHSNIESIRALLQQFDVPVPKLLLKLKILAVSTNQSRLWAAEGQQLPGGWTHIANPGSAEYRLVESKQAWLRSNSEARIEAGSIEPIRLDIREWLEQYGVSDTPDLALHPITAGLAFRVSVQNDQHIRLELSPWLKLTQQAQITAPAQVEVLPDLGTTAATLQPPSTVAPIRLNIQPTDTTISQYYISLDNTKAEIDLSLGEPLILLAEKDGAHALGNALLSETIGFSGKVMALQLLLE